MAEMTISETLLALRAEATREREARQKAEEERNAAQAERTAAENALLDIKEAWLTRPKPLSIREAFHRNAPAAIREWDRLADEFVFAADKERNAARSALAAKEAEVERQMRVAAEWEQSALLQNRRLAALREEGARVRDEALRCGALLAEAEFHLRGGDAQAESLARRVKARLLAMDRALASPSPIPTPPAGHDASDHEACKDGECDFATMLAAGFPKVAPVDARPLTYLACPYSHPERSVRIARFEAVNRTAAKLMAAGAKVFSPISHTHPIAEAGALPLGWDFWEAFDRAYIGHSSRVVVLTLDGWEQSKGVQAEIKIAAEYGIPVEYLAPAPAPAPVTQDEVLRCPYCDAPRKAAEIGKHVGEHCQTFRARFGLPLPGEAAAPVTQGDARCACGAHPLAAGLRDVRYFSAHGDLAEMHGSTGCLPAAPVTTPAQGGES